MVRILLNERLAERKWTQAHFAELAGVRAATVNEWYNDMQTRLDLPLLERFCNVLQCDVSDLIEIRPQNKRANIIIRSGPITISIQKRYLKKLLEEQ